MTMIGEHMKPRRRIYLWALVLFTSLAALVGGGVLLMINAYGQQRVQEAWLVARPAITAGKWAAMILLIVRWPQVAGWLACRFGLGHDQARELTDKRWRLAAALVTLELVLGQGLLGLGLAA